jgi:allene oxide cyclase
MRRSLIAVACLALVTVLAIVATARGKQQALTSSFRVIEHATTDTVTNTGKKGDSVGDILTFANAVYNGANTQKVGTDNGECVRTAVGKAWECWWTTFLAGGQLTVEGPFDDAGDTNLAITGGTGKYARARGWMKLHARNAQGTEYDFVFHVQG